MVARACRPDVLGVFVKTPAPGQVKTRLAAAVGGQRAAAIYRDLGRRVIAACAGADHDTVVWVAPANARQTGRDWADGVRRGGCVGARVRSPGGARLGGGVGGRGVSPPKCRPIGWPSRGRFPAAFR